MANPNPISALPAGQAITLSSVIQLIVNVKDFVLIISGVIVTGFVVWAGITMATAGGDEKRFSKGKQMLINALWGALVIFGVGVILQTLASFAQAPTQIIR